MPFGKTVATPSHPQPNSPFLNLIDFRCKILASRGAFCSLNAALSYLNGTFTKVTDALAIICRKASILNNIYDGINGFKKVVFVRDYIKVN